VEELLTIIQGLIQGFTEIFPISSSGHLLILSELLHLPVVRIEDSALFHLGSMFAIGLFYGGDTWNTFSGKFGNRARIGSTIAIVLTFIIGITFKLGLLNTHEWTGLETIFFLFVNGLFLIIASRWLGEHSSTKVSLSRLNFIHLVVFDEALSLFAHGNTFPGHGHHLLMEESVTYVPERFTQMTLIKLQPIWRCVSWDLVSKFGLFWFQRYVVYQRVSICCCRR